MCKIDFYKTDSLICNGIWVVAGLSHHGKGFWIPSRRRVHTPQLAAKAISAPASKTRSRGAWSGRHGVDEHVLGGLFSSPGSVWTRSSVNLRGRSHCWSGSGSFSRSGSNGAAAIMIGPHRPPPLHPTFRVGRDRGTMVAEVERREAYLPTTMWSRPPAAAHWSAVNNCLPHVQASSSQPVAVETAAHHAWLEYERKRPGSGLKEKENYISAKRKITSLPLPWSNNVACWCDRYNLTQNLTWKQHLW